MSVYDTIRQGLQDDWRKAREYDHLKRENEQLLGLLRRGALAVKASPNFKCIHDSKSGYCDNCPLAHDAVCNLSKEFSK